MANATTNDVRLDDRDGPARSPAVPGAVAARLKAGRARRELSVRGLAREVGVSPSLISQIENGKANPSIGTLYAIVSVLGISLDQLFASDDPPPPGGGEAERASGVRDAVGVDAVVVPAGSRPSLQLDGGVRWERLTPFDDPQIDFLSVTYRSGAESCPPDALLRVNGRQFGLVVQGHLGVTVGFESYEARCGDSLVLEAAVPHRVWALGDGEAIVVWAIVGRSPGVAER